MSAEEMAEALKLAATIVSGAGRGWLPITHQLARALIACREPVELKRDQINTCECGQQVSGYKEDQIGAILPNFHSHCGKALTWK